jgi:hypothetical protein
VTRSDVTCCLGQSDCPGKNLGGQCRVVRIEQRPTQVAVSRGVFWLEFDGALKRLDGFSRPPHFHQGASQSRPAPLIGWVVLEQLAESRRLADKDVWVAVRQLGKVTEVPSARPAKCWIVYPVGESFGWRRGLAWPFGQRRLGSCRIS